MSTSVEDRADKIDRKAPDPDPTPTGERDKLIRQIRAARAPALAAGRRPPGSRAIAKALKVPRHEVRKVLEAGDADPPDPNRTPAPDPVPARADHPGEAGVRPSPAPHPVEPEPVPEPASAVDLEPAPAPARPLAAHPHARASRSGGRGRWTLVLIGFAAGVAVWGGWVDLGEMTGFGLVHPLPGLPGWAGDLQINTAITLPIGIEAYGAYALRVWLSSTVLSARTRRFARRSAWASLAVGAGAQIASHLMHAAGMAVAPWWITMLVACVPVAVLGLAVGLATLVRRDTHPGDEAGEGGR